MAYFVDRAQMKIINFIPVRMVGAPPVRALGSYSGLGAPPPANLPTRQMSARDIQLRLMAAGKLAPGPGDGIWGPASRTAMREFVRTLPRSVRSMDIPWNSRFYKSARAGQLIIPEAWAAALPRPATPTAGGARAQATPDGAAASTTGAPVNVQPADTSGQPVFVQGGAKDGSGPAAIAPQPGAPPGPAAPGASPVATSQATGPTLTRDDSGGIMSRLPWKWIGYGAVGLAGLVVLGVVVRSVSTRD